MRYWYAVLQLKYAVERRVDKILELLRNEGYHEEARRIEEKKRELLREIEDAVLKEKR